jgi:NADPH:quinone reductase-like Zn-dependent oxidoreductase
MLWAGSNGHWMTLIHDLKQIALNAGAKVIITSSSDNKITQVKQLLEPLVRPGSPEDVLQAINYNTTPDWDKEVAKLTGGRKVDIVIEISGRATLGKSIRSTRSGGLVAISGYLSDYSDLDPKIKEEGKWGISLKSIRVVLSRTTFDVDLAKTLLYSAVNARGNFVGKQLFYFRQSGPVDWSYVITGNKQQFMDMNRAFEIGGVRPVVDKVFEFEQLREAYDYLQSAKHIGKVVVKVSTWFGLVANW